MIYRVFFLFHSKSSILKAPYIGYIDLNAPTFGDISVLAKGKLKRNANKTFSFEQINERCDEKCQMNADKYLENVTALWMVERIRHRDGSGNNHHFDLKFTIVPIYNDNKQIDHNILENRLRHHMKRTFILRDSDYPHFFNPNDNRRTDIFERSFTSFMSMHPNSLMQSILGVKPNQQTPPPPQKQVKDKRLNKGEFYMAPKIMNSAKTVFNPTVNGHANHIMDHRVRFPDSREVTAINKPPMNLYRPKPELYMQNNIVDYRGANDNVFVGSQDQHYHHHHVQQQQQQQQVSVPVFQIPVDMPIIQLQSPYAFPFQLQLSTPSNQAIYQQQPDVTTFRYQQQLIGAPLFNHYLPISLLPNKSKTFHESERYTMPSYYSPPDPVFHASSTTEAPPISTYSPRLNNYANILRQQINMPVISTASSVQVHTYDDNEFRPMSPSYDVRKFTKTEKEKPKPNSINEQLDDIHDANENVTIPYVTLSTKEEESEKTNEVGGYNVIEDRQKSSSMKPTEKPVLKWIPKRQRKVTTTTAPFIPTLPPSSEATTTITTASTTQSATTKLAAIISRGRNRYNKRNSSLSLRAATISPITTTTKLPRKKTTTMTTIATSPYPTTLFPTYVTPQPTDEPITSLSTSISLEVNGERIFDTTTTTPGYELIPAAIESIQTNSSNVKLFKASVVPEKFDDFTFSILNHAKVLENKKDEN